MTLVDTETAAYATGLTQRWIQQRVRQGRLTNYGTPRRVLVDLDEALTVCDDPHHIASA